MILDYAEFKSKLSMYKRYKRQYQKYYIMAKDIEDEEKRIPSMFPETTIINGKVIPIPKAHGDPKQMALYRLKLIDIKAKYERIRDNYHDKYKEIEEVLYSLPYDLYIICMRIYVQKEGMEKIAREKNFSKAGLAYKIDKELEMFFEKYNFERFEGKT